MKLPSMARTAAFAALVIAAATVPAAAADPARETVVPAYAYPLANVPGKTITALIVSYAPGAKTPAHRHGQAFVVAYVLEGAIRSKVDGVERVYKAGESWTEMPGAHHQMSENASTTEPARLMAVLVHATGAKDLLSFDEAKPKPAQ